MREKEDTKEGLNSFSKKIEYVWMYYKMPIVLALIGLIIVGMLIFSWTRPRKETILDMIIVNQKLDTEQVPQLQNRLLDLIGTPGDNQRVHIDGSFLLDDSQTDHHVVADERLVSYLVPGMTDLLIADVSDMERYAKAGFLADLEAVLTEEERKQYEGQIYQTDKEIEPGVMHSYGIYLGEQSLMYEIAIPYGNPVIAIVKQPPHEEYAKKALRIMVKGN